MTESGEREQVREVIGSQIMYASVSKKIFSFSSKRDIKTFKDLEQKEDLACYNFNNAALGTWLKIDQREERLEK